MKWLGKLIAWMGSEVVIFGLRRKMWPTYRAGNRLIVAGLNLRYPQRRQWSRERMVAQSGGFY